MKFGDGGWGSGFGSWHSGIFGWVGFLNWGQLVTFGGLLGGCA